MQVAGYVQLILSLSELRSLSSQMHHEIHYSIRQNMLVTSIKVFCVISVSSMYRYTVCSVLVGIQCCQNAIKSSVAISSSLSSLLLVIISLAQIVPER